MSYNHRKNCLRGPLTGLLSLLLVGLMLTSCGDDEPKTTDNPPAEEEPVFPSGSEEDDDDNTEEEQTPDETEEPNYGSNYYIPEKSEFYGAWVCYWEKCETYRCFNGKWEKTDTEITDESNPNRNWWGWPYQIAFIQDAWEQHKMIWGSPAYRLDKVQEVIADKGNWSYDGLYIENGLLSGNVYQWIWYDDNEMIVLKNGKNVAHRWKISKFDGNNFTVSPPFNDFPQPVEGSTTFRHTRIYRRYLSDK